VPVYTFRSDDGESHEVALTMRDYPRDGVITLPDGRKAIRDFKADMFGTRPPGNWPRASWAMAVSPKTIAQAEKHDREKGVPTHYDRQGRPVYTSPEHQNAHYALFGCHDKDGVRSR
jgi:hypothetical protein